MSASEALPPADHNEPTTTLRAGGELAMHLDMTYEEIVARTNELLEKGQRYLTISNDAEDSDATQFLVALRACWKAGEAARVAEKSPYDDAAGAVHAYFKTNVLDPLGLASDSRTRFDPVARTDLGLGPRITMALTLYKTKKADEERRRREEEARVAAEQERLRRAEAHRLEEEAREAERVAARKRNEDARAAADAQAAEARRKADEARAAENRAAEDRAAAQAAAAVPAADLSRSRGRLGGVSSLKETIEFRDLDRDTIDLEALRPYLPDKALQQAVRAWADANKATVNTGIKNETQPLKGVVFYRDQRAAGRA